MTRAHVIAWRKDMKARSLASTSIRRKLPALSSLFDYLCERNAVLGNPVDAVKCSASNNNEGSTPALGDGQVRRLLEAPRPDTLKRVFTRADSLLESTWSCMHLHCASYFWANNSVARASLLSIFSSFLASHSLIAIFPTPGNSL